MMALRDAVTGRTLTAAPGTMLAIAAISTSSVRHAQLVTLRTGDIADEATYGADFHPDWPTRRQ
jgi:hypothetical protein